MIRKQSTTEHQAIKKGKNTQVRLVTVRSRTERIFFRTYLLIIPAIYLTRGLVQFVYLGSFPPAFYDSIKITAELALMLALFFSNRVFAALPNLLSQLFTGKSLLEKDEGTTAGSFTSDFDKQLNRPIRKVAGLVAALAVLVYYVARIGGPGNFPTRANLSFDFLDLLLYIFPSVFYGYFAGIVAWKLAITSWRISRTPKLFNVNVRFGHPDQAGGLLPAGELLLKMLYVPVTPTILSAIIIFTPMLSRYLNIDLQIANRVLLVGFAPLILITGIVGSAIALIPLFVLHRVMVEQEQNAISQLQGISENIVRLRNRIASSQSEEEFRESVQTLEVMETYYGEHRKLNTWPLDRRALTRIWSTQVFLFGQAIALFGQAIALWNAVTQLL